MLHFAVVAVLSLPAAPVTFQVEVPSCTPPGETVFLRSDRLDAGTFIHDALTRVDDTHLEGTFDVVTPFAALSYKYSLGTCDAASCPGIEKDILFTGSGGEIADRRLTTAADALDDVVAIWRDAIGTATPTASKVAFCGPYLSIGDVDGAEVVVGYDSYRGQSVTIEHGPTPALGTAETQPAAHRHHFRIDAYAPGTTVHYRIIEGSRTTPVRTFRTPVPPGQPFSFAILGDTQFITDADRERIEGVVAQMEAFAPDLVVSVGDLVQSDREADGTGFLKPEMGRFMFFYDRLKELASRAPLMVSMGNHEEDVDYFFNVFAFPTPDAPAIDHYSYRVGGVLFVHMYTGITEGYDFDGIMQSQNGWLTETLAAADAGIVFKAVVLHRGPFSQGERHPTDGQAFHDAGWGDIWANGGVDLVIAGHNHNFTWALDGDIHYITTCGGAPVHPLRSPDEPTTIYAEEGCAAGLVSVGARTMTFEARRPDGTRINEAAFSLCHADNDCAELASPCGATESAQWSCLNRLCSAACVAEGEGEGEGEGDAGEGEGEGDGAEGEGEGEGDGAEGEGEGEGDGAEGEGEGEGDGPIEQECTCRSITSSSSSAAAPAPALLMVALLGYLTSTRRGPRALHRRAGP